MISRNFHIFSTLLLFLAGVEAATTKKIKFYIDSEPGLFSRFHAYKADVNGNKVMPKARLKYMNSEWVFQQKKRKYGVMRWKNMSSAFKGEINVPLIKVDGKGIARLYFIGKIGSKFSGLFNPRKITYKSLLTVEIDTNKIKSNEAITCGLKLYEGSRKDSTKAVKLNSGGGVCKVRLPSEMSRRNDKIFNQELLYFTGMTGSQMTASTMEETNNEKLKEILPKFAIKQAGPLSVNIKSSSFWNLRRDIFSKRPIFFIKNNNNKVVGRPDFTLPGGKPAMGAQVAGIIPYHRVAPASRKLLDDGEFNGDFASIKLTPVGADGDSLGMKEVEFNRKAFKIKYQGVLQGLRAGLKKRFAIEPNQLMKVEFDAPRKFLGRDLTIGYLGYVGESMDNKPKKCVLDIRKNSMWEMVDKKKIGQALSHYVIAQQVRISEIGSIDKQPYLNLTVSLRGSDKGCRFIPKNNLATIVRPQDDDSFNDGVDLVVKPESFDISTELGIRHVLVNGRINTDYQKKNLINAYLDVSDEYHKKQYKNRPFEKSYKIAAGDRVDIGFITKDGAWEPGKKLSAPFPEVVIEKSAYEYFVTITAPKGKGVKKIEHPKIPGKFRYLPNPSFKRKCEITLKKGKGWDEEMGQIIVEKRGGCIVKARKRGVEMYDQDSGIVEPIIKIVDLDKMEQAGGMNMTQNMTQATTQTMDMNNNGTQTMPENSSSG